MRELGVIYARKSMMIQKNAIGLYWTTLKVRRTGQQLRNEIISIIGSGPIMIVVIQTTMPHLLEMLSKAKYKQQKIWNTMRKNV